MIEQIVDDFFSVAPQYRTKEHLRQLLLTDRRKTLFVVERQREHWWEGTSGHMACECILNTLKGE